MGEVFVCSPSLAARYYPSSHECFEVSDEWCIDSRRELKEMRIMPIWQLVTWDLFM